MLWKEIKAWSHEHWKHFILILVITLVLSFATTYELQKLVAPKLCSSCHEGLSVAQAMQKGNHTRFKCEQCHRETGIGISLIPKTNIIPDSVQGKIPVDKEICLECHAIENRQVTPRIPIKVPHKEHLAKGIQCVQCHIGVVHGQRPSRGAGVVTFKGPAMPTCIKCHLERGVPTNCSWCHLQDLKPQSHQDRNKWVWKGEHGLMAQKDVGVCEMCHAYTKDRAVNMGNNNKPAEFARSNAFCSGCHINKPPSHTEIWPIVHKQQAIPNRAACLVCHNENKPDPSERITQRIYCFKCHKPRDGIQGNITNHPTNWRKLHPNVVKSIGIVEGKCFNCHASNHCAKCHRAYNIHQIN
ncbi:hypothetical protein [Carboxydocella sp. JDF658]|uniref:hypothetical protein n=1 Tax=Carboxydocella sp. JDF658 TaxID=1926600 RepID=UPI0009ABC05F|nr:hypothetical protein [Carboxydocella sp. JDF658]